MFEDVVVKPKGLDRRSFLRGSALFAAALGLGATAPAFAQQPPPQPPPEKEKKEPEKKEGEKKEGEPKKDPDPAEQDKDKKVLRDAEGREYRVCPQCGANMYKQGRTWTCDNCGYSYVE